MVGAGLGDVVGMIVGSRFKFCFVAGTQVLMAEEDRDELYAAIDAVMADPDDLPVTAPVDYAMVAVGVGSLAIAVVGHEAMRRRRVSDELAKYERTVDSVFEDDDWDSVASHDDNPNPSPLEVALLPEVDVNLLVAA